MYISIYVARLGTVQTSFNPWLDKPTSQGNPVGSQRCFRGTGRGKFPFREKVQQYCMDPKGPASLSAEPQFDILGQPILEGTI